jgi:hypothetical protein
VIEAPQNPLRRRNRPHVVGARNHKHRDQAEDVDHDGRDLDARKIDCNDDDCDGADEAERNASRMDDAVGNDLNAMSQVILPGYACGDGSNE